MNPKLTILALVAGLGACAAPQPRGAVLPMQGGIYQSVVKGPDQAMANKIFDSDAKLTCGSAGAVRVMDKPGKYVVLSQNGRDKDGKKVEADSKTATAGLTVGLRYLGLESKDSYELTSTFKCEAS